MPDTNQDRSKLFSQVKKGLSKSFDKAKTKAPVKRGQQLPGGIVNGHATLSSWNIAKTEDKKVPYLSITGIVTQPEEHEGARATVTHYLQPNDWNTWEDITMNLVSDLKLLGAEHLDARPMGEQLELDDLPEMLDELCEGKPEFLFNTRTGKRKSKDRDPMVYVSIQGLVGDEEAGDSEEDEDDDEEADTEGEDTEESEDEEDSKEEGGESDDAEGDSEGDEEEEVSESVVPEKGDACNFKTSPKKTELVEILRVFKDKETVNLKVSESGKVFKDVPWAKLIWEEQE